jgi:hypothetical protein
MSFCRRIRFSPHLCRRSAGRPDSPDYTSGPEPTPPSKPFRSSKSPKPECASELLQIASTRACSFEVNSRWRVDAGPGHAARHTNGHRTKAAAYCVVIARWTTLPTYGCSFAPLWAISWLVNQTNRAASFWTDLIMTLDAISA